MKVNEKIYSLRKENHMSQEELADKIGVSRQTVSKWELGESSPDFDKIAPLCELFNITADELLRDKKIESVETPKEDKPDVVKAALICGSVLLYFIAIVSIIFTTEYLNLNDGVAVSIFLLICGIATVMIIFACMTRPSKKVEKTTSVKRKNPVLEGVISVVTLIATAIYLLVSFMTMAWHITWIIWIIYAIIVKIIKLVFVLNDTGVESDGDNNEE